MVEKVSLFTDTHTDTVFQSASARLFKQLQSKKGEPKLPE
jgi:hypothetical protein